MHKGITWKLLLIHMNIFYILQKMLLITFLEQVERLHPLLVGTARKNEIRLKLAIATGCIIDSYGNTSTQTDVILYEIDQCLIFSINDTTEATYIPCEGVVAI